jgi:predicted TIM-barrel fold metal-dependent hydrolase
VKKDSLGGSSQRSRRYPGRVFDAHCHFDAEWEADALRIRQANRLGWQLNLWNLEWPPRRYKTWRSRFRQAGSDMLFCHTPDLSGIGTEGFERTILHGVHDAAGEGAAGIKIWKNLGLRLRDAEGRLLRVDDPRLDVLWDAASEAEMPVFIHVGDPKAFFQPRDSSNERYRELSEHPDWWFGGSQYPSFDELMIQFRRVVESHPNTTFVGVHFGCCAEDVDFVASMLEACPNYFIDTSGRLGEIGRQPPELIRSFFLRFVDRILFGSDLARTYSLFWPEEGLYVQDFSDFYNIHWRYYETDEDGIPNPFPIQGQWVLRGIDLPQDVLSRMYLENALDLLSVRGAT